MNARCIPWLLELILMGVPVAARSQTETVLYSFASTTSTDGFQPAGGLLLDSSGNLFGTTVSGSHTLCDLAEVYGCGIVYELVKSSNGYTEQVLYSFGSSSATTDGASPEAGLVTDAAGNLYGTTTYGGSPNCLIDIGVDGCGTVFELVKSSNGYTENVLYTFTGTDGAYPYAGLTMDSSGNLYGTTYNGGACGLGTVFELAKSSGAYTEKVLYSFGCTSTDGWYPYAGLIMDAVGNLYGTTESAGGSGYGMVFELVNSSGDYTEKVLYNFTGTDGQMPSGNLIFDSKWNLYGTTQGGGEYGYGTVFELTNSLGGYTEKVLYSFMGPGDYDGQTPVPGLVIDGSGNLYGTTRWGGSYCAPQGCGIVFELVNSSGAYTEKILHRFGAASDGENPAAPLVIDSAGSLFSTTDVGGATGCHCGTVFMVNPTATPTVTLSASGLTFSSQPVGTTSTAQAVSLTNKGGSMLSITSVTVSASFIQTNTCGSSLAAGGSCMINVMFAPATVGSLTGVLSVVDDDRNSPQTASLTGTGTGPVASASPASVVFIGQIIGKTSGAETITVSNTGNADLTIFSVAISGANAGDFAIVSSGTTCVASATVAAGLSCALNVMFTPTASGTRNAILAITDNSYDQTSSTQNVALSGSGEDFGVAVASGTSSSATVTPGGTASYTVSVSPEGGFNQTVKLSCAGAPSEATCSVNSNSLVLNGRSSSTATVTVTTTAASLTFYGWKNGGDDRLRLQLHWSSIWLMVWLVGLSVAIVDVTLRHNWRREIKAVLWRTMLAAILASETMLVSCGGGSSGPPQNPGTPVGSYSLTITGTSGNLSHSTTLTLSVD